MADAAQPGLWCILPGASCFDCRFAKLLQGLTDTDLDAFDRVVSAGVLAAQIDEAATGTIGSEIDHQFMQRWCDGAGELAVSAASNTDNDANSMATKSMSRILVMIIDVSDKSRDGPKP